VVAQDDNIYIKQVLDGNTSSFTHLVDKYKNMVYTVVYRILRQHEDAEEIAQDTFIKAFNNLQSFEGNSKFSTWIYTIAYRSAISKTRLKKVDTVTEDFLLDSSIDGSVPQLEELEAEEQSKYVKEAIEALPEVDGVIVTLYYMDDMNIQEISEITTLSESNIKVKLFRARKQLKENLHSLLKHELKNIV
jgi:RNA polymerase sigma-70 factor (ECF subfamily)